MAKRRHTGQHEESILRSHLDTLIHWYIDTNDVRIHTYIDLFIDTYKVHTTGIDTYIDTTYINTNIDITLKR
jgi:hypothetical protein